MGSLTTLECNPVLTQYNFLVTQARQSIDLLPPTDNIIRMMGSLSLPAAVVAFVISGWIAAGLTLVVGMVLTAAVIMRKGALTSRCLPHSIMVCERPSRLMTMWPRSCSRCRGGRGGRFERS